VSLKAKLIWSYLVILGIGGLVTSLVGSWIVSSTIMTQARRAVDHDFASARAAYQHQLERLELSLRFAAAGPLDLERLRAGAGFDFVAFSGGSHAGTVPAGAAQAAVVGAGIVASGTESLPGGLYLMAAAPSRGGVLYGGVLLNGNNAIVDRAWQGRLDAGDNTSMTLYHRDTRIATTLRTPQGMRATGTRASAELRDAVLARGEVWYGRAYAVDDWYIGAYQPLRDYRGRIVGMLAVALRESTYIGIRDRVILSFFGIATAGFIFIIAITYYMIRSITRPIGEMVAATRNISAGRFDQEVRADSPGEIALLAESFNGMLHSLRQMKADLEEWGRTLEQKVKQRTDELVAMQARVAQSERLASLGMLAAGVAHEVNNPLGGILALTALTLEDLPETDTNRENLQEVIRQTQRCRDIVRRLLEFSRQTKRNTELVDLNRVLVETLALVERQASFFNIQVVKDLDPRLPPVQADAAQFQQVFMNILVNAAQAMEERGTITLTTRYTGWVEVLISDTGHGISSEQIDMIFDPFFTTKESGQGTGLGLSIAYGIVTTHGGTISVNSEEGKGSTFTIRMPAGRAVV